MRKATLLIGMMLLASLPALAQAPSYTFVEAGWLQADPDGGSSEDGWFAGGSFGLNRLHFFAEYGDLSDAEVWEAGGGWHGLFGERLDLVAQASFVDLDSDDGYKLTGGVRWMLLEKLEVNGFMNYLDTGSDNDTSIEVNGIWNLGQRFGVGAGYEAGDQLNWLRAFARFNFGGN